VLGELLRRRLRQLAEEATTTTLRGRLRAFTNVLVPDGCAFKVYPGRAKMQS